MQSQITPLHTAVSNGMNEIAKLLIEYGANINAQDCHGRYEQFSIMIIPVSSELLTQTYLLREDFTFSRSMNVYIILNKLITLISVLQPHSQFLFCFIDSYCRKCKHQEILVLMNRKISARVICLQ